MIWPHRITFSGADERTSLDDLRRLLRHRRVEIGLLYTATPEGRNRYPSLSWIRSVAQAFPGRCALHICGRGARAALLAEELDDILRLTPRVQVNGLVLPDEARELVGFVDTLITQHNTGNLALAGLILPHHALLVDASAGRGLMPTAWERPDVRKPVGFAGGLGPDTIAEAIPRITAVADHQAWIDMEERIRTDDWFDAQKAHDVLDHLLELQHV